MTLKLISWPAALLAGAISITPAAAQTAADQPAAASTVTPICTDRPTKANSICTVPTGALQLETDAINWTTNRDGGVRTDVILYTNPYLKYGLGPKTDIEVNIAPYETVRVSAGGSHDTIGGIGDLYVRLKQQLTDSSAKVQVGVIPFVKAPTARIGIGNRKWEGGVALPIVFTLPQGFTLNLGPEVDLLADSDGHGRHAQAIGVVNLSKSVGKATLYGELWSAHNFDPAGTVHQYSADVAVAYLVAPTLQLDVGGNFGLNRFTPDAQVYAGISTRF